VVLKAEFPLGQATGVTQLVTDTSLLRDG
jgi:hypothetical protein